MKLLIASNNAHKVREIEEILSGYFDEMVTMKEAGLDIDVVEDGKTFRDNAVKRPRRSWKKAAATPRWRTIRACAWTPFTGRRGSTPPATPGKPTTLPPTTPCSWST